MKSLSRVRLFTTLWTLAYQAPPSMEFSRQEYWSGLPFPSPGDLPDQGLKQDLKHCRQTLYSLSELNLNLKYICSKAKLVIMFPCQNFCTDRANCSTNKTEEITLQHILAFKSIQLYTENWYPYYKTCLLCCKFKSLLFNNSLLTNLNTCMYQNNSIRKLFQNETNCDL